MSSPVVSHSEGLGFNYPQLTVDLINAAPHRLTEGSTVSINFAQHHITATFGADDEPINSLQDG